jgi:hypothetical protein
MFYYGESRFLCLPRERSDSGIVMIGYDFFYYTGSGTAISIVVSLTSTAGTLIGFLLLLK